MFTELVLSSGRGEMGGMALNEIFSVKKKLVIVDLFLITGDYLSKTNIT